MSLLAALLEQPRLGELAALAELGADGALEVVLRQRDLLLGGEERRAQGRVADVAAGHLVAAGEVGEVELAGERQLLGEVDAPQALAGFVVGEREGEPARRRRLNAASIAVPKLVVRTATPSKVSSRWSR